ncbi:lysylphosphatidylglycerol synthase transmembrane domain-containing protein [Phenylobacterium sp.]|uniref:lysylphosphatidylglycerol synthase transmembrane domain-containing protein n=1 Tax=Phenylobacterium sp. TaxID=1871053 RepID=UPI003BA8D5B2
MKLGRGDHFNAAAPAAGQKDERLALPEDAPEETPAAPAVPRSRTAPTGRPASLWRLGSRAVQPLFAVAMLVAAAWVLHREFRGVTGAEIGHALGAVPAWALVAAACASALSYASATGSDWWALTTVGKRLAAWRIFLATFVACALANGLGFSAATGGAARLRFYRDWGLSPAETGLVILLAGIAALCAGGVAAGLALLLAPGLSPLYRGLGLLLLTPIAFWFVPWQGLARGWRAVSLSRPPWPSSLLALAAGMLDWVFSGLVLFLLLPDPSLPHFLPFIAIFVLGALAGLTAGLPGGLGVLDAVVLTLGGRFATPQQMAAGLLLYRLVHAAAPLLIAAVAVGVHQALRRPAATPLP